MWLSSDGTFNTVRVDPKYFLSKRLRRDIDDMSDMEKVRLDIDVRSQRESVIQAIMSVPYSAEERDFEGLVLPDEFQIDLAGVGVNLTDAIMTVVASTPLRWRLERADLIPQYVADYGPSWRKYKKLVRAIDR